ncbi:MAG: 2,3-bisphosphoglycerate-independent phosphoglycerate mutase [Planctomycetota bacterium]|jgi:2,3-bisphosphoglycerate-independent phosphoglycerate mutase
MKQPPVVLLVLDGWGQREAAESNAIQAGAPYFHELLGRYPHALLDACGQEVGLPAGIMGNSEVGHMNLGAGRVVYQDVSRIDRAIETGEFERNAAFTNLIERLRKEGKRLHLVGLVSDGGVHASDKHLARLLGLAAKLGMPAQDVLVHAITDGRDSAPRSGKEHLARLEAAIVTAGVGRIASVVGRYWAMDRDKRWERVQRAYELFVGGEGARAESALAALDAAYAADTGDEFVEPTVIGEAGAGCFEDGDGVLMFNYRSDRVRQICSALSEANFGGFERCATPTLEIVTMTRYRADFPFAIAFAPQELKETFPEVISAAGLRQARIAETEKYAHVTFFFSGGLEALLPGEDRVLLPSPKVATYDLQPEMSAPGVCDAVLRKLAEGETEVLIVNFANADMVGHTGFYDAAVKAVQTIDECLRRIVPAVTKLGGTLLITADHGNAEQLADPGSGGPHTAHTMNPVPIVLCGDAYQGQKMRAHGVLADVAPTLLEILKLPAPAVMNGKSLLHG